MQPPLLKFVCPLCGRAAGVPVTMAGHKVKCPSCQGVIRAPAAPATAPAAQSAPTHAAAPVYSTAASTQSPTGYRRPRGSGMRSAAVFIAIGVLCVAFLSVLFIAAYATPKRAPLPTSPDASASQDTAAPSTMTSTTPVARPSTQPEEPTRPLDPSIKNGDGTVRIAGVTADGSGVITGGTPSQQTESRLVGFVPTYDQFEETTTLRSRPSLLVRATGEGKGMLQFSVAAVFNGRRPNGLDRAQVYVELVAVGTDWQDQEVGPALGLLLQWEEQQVEFPIEFKTPLDKFGGEPAMRLSYLLTLDQFEQLAKSRGGFAFIQNQQFRLADEHFQSFKRLHQYLKTGNPS